MQCKYNKKKYNLQIKANAKYKKDYSFLKKEN